MNLKIPQATKTGYVEVQPGGIFDMSYPHSTTRRGRVQGHYGDIAPTITRITDMVLVYEETENKNIMTKTQSNGANTPGVFTTKDGRIGRIRKLTPRECFRLMGVEDKHIDKIQASGISNSQQYKMAGNSIVVDVLFGIFNNLLIDEDERKTERMTTLF